MHRIRIMLVLAALGCGLSLANEVTPENRTTEKQVTEEQVTDNERLFVRRIAPLLTEKCWACHGNDPDDIQGGLDLRALTPAVAGGDSGEASVIAGEPEQSPLYLAVKRDDANWSAMPPKESEAFSEEQLAWVADWIRGGASWPDETRAAKIAKQFHEAWSAEDGITVATSGGLSNAWTERRYKPESLWGYQPVTHPHPETTMTPSEAIDHWIARRMPQGLDVAPPADRATLIRRATFDLIGLPPSPEEIASFVSDPRGDDEAFADLVSRLLASPHYGERMARHWLDVVRYADSSGFANDFERGNAWRFRDYVIRSFNNDKPFDQFIREQIAGDEIDPEDPEMIIATGFLRMGPWELTGMEVAKVARQRFLDDVTNSVGETFLAHSLQCARCHDHKFDPVPTRDYYAIQAVFATTQLTDREAPLLDVENTQGFEERQYITVLDQAHSRELETLDEALLANAQAWFDEKGLSPDVWNAEIAKEKNKKQSHRSLFNAVRNRLMSSGTPEEELPPKLVGFTPEQFGKERVARKGKERLAWTLERYEPYALAVYNGPTPQKKSVTSPMRMPKANEANGEFETTCILGGGDPFSPTESVTPGVLSVLDELVPAKVTTEISGRRRDFAQWVADARNPLTTRAIVNRLWLWHFGQAIAGNPNNFGSTGKPPTHPELLDFLASSLVAENWSIKTIHRHLMMSQAYRRSSQHPDPEALAERDPHGTSYAVFQPRRLMSEELRDAMLSVTGELNPTVGGIPNRPEINMEAAMQPRQVMGTFAEAWVPNPLPEQRHRRSIYSLKLRGLVDPFHDVFNAPSSDFSCERRETSTVTPQVFSLFNSQNSADRSLALANRVASEVDRSDKNAVIQRCFELALGRRPSDNESKLCLDHWNKQIECVRGIPVTRQTFPKKIVRAAVEENTGENFEFSEPLPAYADFVPDLQPADVSVDIRALADICLVLLNSNEFVYVY